MTKNKLGDIIVCQYAGDPEDEFCSGCNGKTMEIDGEVFCCTECQGYTPKQVCEKPAAEPRDSAQNETEQVETNDYTPMAITTSIKAESGLSIETKKGWYRFSYTEERIVPESADIEKEKEALWNAVNNEVDRQAEEVRLMLAEIKK